MYCFVILLLFNEMQMSVRRFLQSRTLEEFLRLVVTLHTVKFELTNQHSVGGKNCGVLTSCRFCALRFDFCVISEVYTVEMRFYFSVNFLQINRLPYFNLLKSQLFAIIWAG